MSDKIDLSEWWTVLTNGEWWAGKRGNTSKADDSGRVTDGRKLECLQKLSFQFGMIETPGGIRPKMVALTYPWLGMETMIIPDGALWTAVSAYRSPEIDWAAVIGSTEKLKLEQRAQRSGLHLARH
jgi:hypothetical protein